MRYSEKANTMLWVEKVINSCETLSQLDSARRLVNNFYEYTRPKTTLSLEQQINYINEKVEMTKRLEGAIGKKRKCIRIERCR